MYSHFHREVEEKIRRARCAKRLPNPVDLVRDTVLLQPSSCYDVISVHKRITLLKRERWNFFFENSSKPWTQKQQSDFLGYFICGGFMPPIVLWDLDSVEPPGFYGYDVIDGIQRCKAIVDWVDGKVDAWLPEYESHLSYSKLSPSCRHGNVPTTIYGGDSVERALEIREFANRVKMVPHS